jgi:hypothetical protein
MATRSRSGPTATRSSTAHTSLKVLADVDEEQQKDLLITGRTPTDEKRVIVGLSRFPREAVAKIRGGGGPGPLSD